MLRRELFKLKLYDKWDKAIVKVQNIQPRVHSEEGEMSSPSRRRQQKNARNKAKRKAKKAGIKG